MSFLRTFLHLTLVVLASFVFTALWVPQAHGIATNMLFKYGGNYWAYYYGAVAPVSFLCGIGGALYALALFHREIKGVVFKHKA